MGPRFRPRSGNGVFATVALPAGFAWTEEALRLPGGALPRVDAVEDLMRAAGLHAVAAEVDLAPVRKRPTRQTYSNNRGSPLLLRRVREFCETLEGYEPRHDALPPAFLKRSGTKQRNASLQRHAEKQALVDLLQQGKEDLRLSVNFHVCLDCHALLRAASRALRRPITVVEPTLTHVFDEEGTCSCGDKWCWEARADA